MRVLDDIELLRRYVERGSEEAFAELVARHVNKVYSVALRQTGDAAAAEEITQAVFVLLARKGPRLGSRVILSGWLYQTARWTSLAHIRGAIRRHQREEEAFMQTELNKKDLENWLEMAPFLDSAMDKLSAKDRHAIVLRFFDGKSLKDVGHALGSSEDAAKKRVTRALEKLRLLFAKRGVRSTTAVIAAAISANSIQVAPPSVAKAVGSAVVGKGLAASQTTTTLIHGALKLMAWNKIKLVALASIGLLVASGTAVVAVETARSAAEKSGGEAVLRQCETVFAQTPRGQVFEAIVPVLTTNRPVAYIRFSQVPRGELIGKTSGFTTEQGHVELGAYLIQVLRYAFDLDRQFPQNRIVVPPDLIYARYDLVNTMGPAGKQRLREELKEQFGIEARHETRKNLLLIAGNFAPRRLHKHNSKEPGGDFQAQNVAMPALAEELSERFGVKVTDQTGLKGGFDFNLDGSNYPTFEALKNILSDQLGLELAPASDNETIDFLVAEKVPVSVLKF